MAKDDSIIWRDRKRNFLGLPWSFTRYRLGPDRFFVIRGFFTTKEDEIRLYRITDLQLTRTLWQKIIKTGTINCCSSDKNMGDFSIRNIKKSHEVKEMLSQMVDQQRKENRVYMQESMNTGGHFMPHDLEDDFYVDANNNGIPDRFE